MGCARCLDCDCYRDGWFEGESPYGFGIWGGYCTVKVSKRHISSLEVKNVYYACERFRPTAKALREKPHLVYQHLFDTLEDSVKAGKWSDAIVRLNRAELRELPRPLLNALCNPAVFLVKGEAEEVDL